MELKAICARTWLPKRTRASRIAHLFLVLLVWPITVGLGSSLLHDARAESSSPVLNGGFEEGTGVGWKEVSSHGRQIIGEACGPLRPVSGSRFACLMVREPSERNIVFQTVRLPSQTPLFLNLRVFGYSEEMCDVPYYDRFAIYVGDWPLVENQTVCRGSLGYPMWQWASFDISPLAGQTVRIAFAVSTLHDGGASLFVIDDVSISRSPKATAY